jgi:hypothetical protein
MLIDDVIPEQQVDEYRTFQGYNSAGDIARGNRLKSQLQPVDTPLAQFRVRYRQAREYTATYHDYYLYDIKTDQCVGLFSIEEPTSSVQNARSFPVVKPGIKVVTPHMSLAKSARRQGVSTQAYTTFLRGGPWVFVTEHHSDAAKQLWDSLEGGNIISVYARPGESKPTDKIQGNTYRLLGPRNRFKIVS